jgi:GntR family transcriptional regulator
MTKTTAPHRTSPKRPPDMDPASHVLPLHHRIYIVLRRRLVEGEYLGDRPMPGEHQLAEDFGASRVTIRRVLDRLEKENLIERRHGVGTFPMRTAAGAQPQPEMSYYDYIAASSHTYDDKLLEYKLLPTPPFLSDIDPRFGSVSLKIVRLAFAKSVPLHILRTYVPGDIAEHVSRRALGNKTVLELLKKRGILPQESELKIGATSADTEEAKYLNMAVGAPLVHAIRVSRLPNGRAIEYNQMLSVADMFGYRFAFDWRIGSVRLPYISVNSKN